MWEEDSREKGSHFSCWVWELSGLALFKQLIPWRVLIVQQRLLGISVVYIGLQALP